MLSKQTTLLFLLPLFLHTTITNAALLLFSNRDVEVPALETFTEDHLKNLLEELNSPKVLAFRVESASMIEDFHKNRFVGNSAYVPSEELNKLKATVLRGSPKENSDAIERQLNAVDDENVLLILIFRIKGENGRRKREIETAKRANTEIKGPVLYSSSDDLIYSSKPLIFKNGTVEIPLGNAFLVTANVKKQNLRVVKANLDLGNNSKMSLCFTFAQLNSGYWRLKYIEIELHNATTIEKYNVSTKQDVTAPARFSYHCSGVTVFKDALSNAQLHMFDMQLQIATKSKRFNDAYDCVPFTTAPIWSGLFVTFILAVGLVVALNAIGSIKTMDKFDNHKTKQLTINVFEY